MATSTCGEAAGQRLLVPHDRPRGLIALVDVRAGALVTPDWIDVQSTASPPPNASALSAAERVRDEVWIAASSWVYRYSVSTREFLGALAFDSTVRSIDAQSRRVVVTTRDFLETLDFDGTRTGRLEVVGAGDTLELRDTMLVAVRDETRIDRYTLAGRRIDVFAGPEVPSTLGVLSRPRQLALRANGNVLVCGDVRVYEFSPDGTFLAEYDVGPFEGGVAETVGGRLFVSLGNGVAVHDAASGATTRVGGFDFGQGRKVGVLDSGLPAVLAPGEASSEVTCPGARNSTGFAARAGALGSGDTRDELFGVFGDRLPPGVVVVLAAGRSPGTTVLNAGTLCIERDAVLLVPGLPLRADEAGRIVAPVLRGSSPAAPLLPGSTWHFQLVFRDGPEVRLSDALRVTFAE
ncbi:MAG: hypothetical protein AAGB93_02485 [Planctomycetota bacterium]